MVEENSYGSNGSGSGSNLSFPVLAGSDLNQVAQVSQSALFLSSTRCFSPAYESILSELG